MNNINNMCLYIYTHYSKTIVYYTHIKICIKMKENVAIVQLPGNIPLQQFNQNNIYIFVIYLFISCATFKVLSYSGLLRSNKGTTNICLVYEF